MKIPVFSYLIIVFALAIFACGCSGNPNVLVNPDLPDTEVSGASSWGAYDMMINTEKMTVDVVPDREMMMEYNINGYLGLCTGGCFKFWIISITGTELEINMQFENPLDLDGWDVRIIFTALNGKTVMNPDSYTDLLDPPYTPETINPFIAFQKTAPDRMFPALQKDIQTLFLDFPPGAFGSTSFIISASYPEQCEEPYEVNNMNYSGNINTTGGLGTISCDVLDHQGDVSYVHAETSPITLGGWSLMSNTGGNTWEVDFTNETGAPVGDYTMLIKAESLNPLQVSTYNYVVVNVEEGQSGECDDMNLFVCADGNWLVDSTIEAPGFDGFEFVTNLVDYNPTGPAANYNTVYYFAGKGGSFRNGFRVELESLVNSLGLNYREQEVGDVDLDDVRVMIWTVLGYNLSDQPTDDEISAMKALLQDGGRIIINCEYNSESDGNAWINEQLARLGSTIFKKDGGTGTNVGLIPNECDPLTNGVGSVLFRAWGYLGTDGAAFTLFEDPTSGLPMFMCEEL